jgi:hypothetical protein
VPLYAATNHSTCTVNPIARLDFPAYLHQPALEAISV